jgi:hypothetical protein
MSGLDRVIDYRQQFVTSVGWQPEPRNFLQAVIFETISR